LSHKIKRSYNRLST